MGNPHRIYEVRCPVYGFVEFNDWEREIISQPAFQRLRRIRQLAWTDYVYPGAMHTRFEHSLGVMHMVSLLYDGIIQRSADELKNALGYNDDGLSRNRQLVRIAALLHDVGHAPFSHAAEELFPASGDGRGRYRHEDYSAAIMRRCFGDVVKNHPLNRNYAFGIDDVANLIEGSAGAGPALFWRDLIVGQMDADRIDYLLRDSRHAGVDYGLFDWRRLVHTIVAMSSGEDEGLRLGVTEGGWHAAEGLILARYFMFTQVYFHKTRVAFDHHLREALREMLPNQTFPRPVDEEIDAYLAWDDWRVLGMLSDGKGGEHGRRLSSRDHYREIAHTPECPTETDLKRCDRQRNALGELLAAEEQAEKSWYKVGLPDIPVASDRGSAKVRLLSKFSSVVAEMKPIRKILLYVRPEDRNQATARLQGLKRGKHG